MLPFLFGSLNKWFSSKTSTKRAERRSEAARVRKQQKKLQYEVLEDRITPTVDLYNHTTNTLITSFNGPSAIQLAVDDIVNNQLPGSTYRLNVKDNETYVDFNVGNFSKLANLRIIRDPSNTVNPQVFAAANGSNALLSASGVYIDGLRFTNSPNPNANLTGIRINANNITVLNSVVEGFNTTGSSVGVRIVGGWTGANVQNNTIDNNYVGVAFTSGAGTNNNTVQNNFIQNSTTTGVDFDASFSGTGTVIRQNQFTGNTTWNINNASASSIDASQNRWGTTLPLTTSETAVSATINGSNVDFTPFLFYGDASPATPGFQQDTSRLTVSTLGTQSGGLGRIQEAVSAVQNGILSGGNRLITALAGTYAENLSIDRALTLQGAQAGVDADTRFAAFTGGPSNPKANPVTETILTPYYNDPTNPNPGANDLLRTIADNITVDGLVIDGNNTAIAGASAVQFGGVDIDARRGITTVDSAGNFVITSGLTIQNNIIQNVAERGVNIDNDGTAPTVKHLVTGNVIRAFGDSGVILFWNAYTDVTNNTIDARTNSIGVSLQNFFSGSQSMTWSANDITVGQDGIGIHVNLFYDAGAALTISGNTVNAATGVTSGTGLTSADDLTWGINLWSLDNTVTVNVTGNTVGASGGQFARGVNLWNITAPASVNVTGGTIGNSRVGINMDATDPYYAGADGVANITNVAITGGDIGIRVRSRQLPYIPLGTFPTPSNPDPNGNVRLNISGGSITGATTGVLIEDSFTDGFTASAQFLGGTTISGATTGLQINGAESAVVGNTLANTVFTGVTGNYVTLGSGALSSPLTVVDGSAVSYNGVVGNAATLAQGFAIENKIFHGTDAASLGYIRITPNLVYVTTSSGSIQRAINVATSGNTIHVEAGTYKENLSLNKSVSLVGPNSGVAGNGVRGSEAIIMTNGNASAVITVTASNASILGFIITGDDTAVTGSPVYSGADANVLYAITNGNTASGTAINNLAVQNNIIQRAAIGYFGNSDTDPSPAFNMVLSTGNTIDNNLFQDIGVFDFGYAISLRNEFNAAITNNVMRRVFTGVSVNNNSVAAPGFRTISGNDIQSYAAGLWYNQAYSTATPLTVSSNQFSISTTNYLLAPLAPSTINLGVLITGGPGFVGGSFTNNTITNHLYGVIVYNSPTAVTFSGTNSIINPDVGVYVTNNLGFNPITNTTFGLTTNNSNVTLNGLTITAATTAGVYVRGDATGGTATVTLTGGTTISSGSTTAKGLQLEGMQALLGSNQVGNTIFNGFAATTNNYISLESQAYAGQVEVDGTAAVFNGVAAGNTLTLANAYAISDRIADYLDSGNALQNDVGFVRLRSGHLYVTQASNSIQRAVNVAISGDTVNVSAGNFNEDVSMLGQPSMTLLGAGAASTTITGQPLGANETVLLDSNQTVDGFTITRLLGLGENNIGLTQASGGTGSIVRNSIFTGNRTAIYVNGSNDQITITRNVITNNRTGILFADTTHGASQITENAIVNNKTFGILFLPSITSISAGLSIFNNNISGNYASQLENNSTAAVNASGNWWGTNTPTVFASSVNDIINANPGVWQYPLPLSPPGAPFPYYISGTGATLIDFTPYLNAGTDTAPATAGFQGDFSDIWVTTVGGQTGAPTYSRIQEGYDLSADPVGPSHGLVRILGGSYSGDVAAAAAKDVDLSPGASPAQVTVNGNFTLNSGVTLVMEINGTTAGSQYDQFVVTGLVTLGNATLSATRDPNVVIPTNTQIRLIDNTSGGAISGQFNGLVEGGTVTLLNIPFTASYVGGTGNDFTLTIIPPVNVWVNGNWFITTDVGAPGLTPGDIVSTTGGQQLPVSGLIFGYNAYVTIQAGVDAVASAGTVNVVSGIYAENVLVNKSVYILGPNAGINPNTGSRIAEAIVVPATVQTSLQASTSGTIFRVGSGSGHIDVTIRGLTIDGHNALLTGGRLLNGVEVHTGAGIVNSIGSFDANPGGYDATMTVQENIIKNLERYGVLADGVPSTTPMGGTDVSFNKIDNLPSGNNFGGGRGRAAAFEENHYGTFSFNVVTRVNVGWQDDNYYLAAPGGLGTVVTGNTISAYHRGIFHNLQYQNATDAVITNNTLSAETSGDFPASTTNFGIELASIQSAVGVTVSGNNVSGTVYGILLWNLPTTATITVSGGTLTGNQYGVYATNVDPQFGDASSSNVTLSGITITNSAVAGIFINDDATNANNATVTAAITGGTSITGGPLGLLVNGSDAFVGGNTLNNTSFTGQSGNYITLSNGAYGSPFGYLNGTGVMYDGVLGSAATVAQGFAIENKITHGTDAAGLGYVRIKPGVVYVTQLSGSIQRGINVATAGDIVHVQGGAIAYVEDVTVNKSISLLGPNVGINPNTGSRVTEAVIRPFTSNPDPFSITSIPVVNVTASNVTIDGFIVDGNNTSNTSGVLVNGVDVDSIEGIASQTGVGNIVVQNNVIRNTSYTGIDFDNYLSAGAATSDNYLRDNLLTNIGHIPYGYGIGILIYDNFYAQITGNVMTAVRLGVQTGNFYQPNPGAAALIDDNEINSTRIGIWHNLTYSAASPFTISNNTLQVTNEVGGTRWFGIQVTSVQGTVGASVTNNTINAAGVTSQVKTGYFLWNNPTSNTVAISGGSVTGADYGVRATNVHPGYGDGASSNASISGVTISGSSIAGIFVDDSVANTNSATVGLTVTGNTSITGSPTGILVSGSDASASITNNLSSIFGNVIGIDVNAGSATITSNSIYNNTTGIRFTAGGSGSVTGNNFLGPITNFLANSTDLRLDSSAGAVSLGAANLFGGGGTTLGQLTNPTGYFIDNRTGQAYNLVGNGTTYNWSDGTSWTALSTGSTADNYRIEDRLYHATDSGTSGLVRVTANQLYVTQPGTGLSDESIQRAVDAASLSGDVVHIEGNTNVTPYVGNVSTAGKSVTLDPGASPAQIFLNGDLTLDSNDTLVAEFTSAATPGVTFDQWVVAGVVTLGGATLNPGSSSLPSTGDNIKLIDNDGVDAIGGTFNGQPNGSIITISGQFYVIFYNGGDGNDVTLTRVAALTPVVTYASSTAWLLTPNGTFILDADFNAPGNQSAVKGYDAFDAIQMAINAVAVSGTVIVNAGTYSEDISIAKALSLLGPNATINPNTGSRVTEAIIHPATQNADFNLITTVPNIYISASNVTVKGFIIDGNNTSLTSGFLVGGVDADSYEAISSYDGVGNIDIQNNTILNQTYAGFDFYNFNNGGAATGDNTLSNNRLQNIGYIPGGYGIGILVYNNFYAAVDNNVMTGVRVGVQTGNFYQANPGAIAPSISNNDITSTRRGIFHNLSYANAATFTLAGNTLSVQNEVGGTEWSGMFLSSIQGTVGVNIIGNTINAGGVTSQTKYGYLAWNNPTTNTVTINGGTVTGADYGIMATNFSSVFGNGNSSSLAINGVTVTNSAVAGIWVNDSPSNTNSATTTVSLTGNTSVTGSPTGILVSGSDASASIINNLSSINGNVIGIDVNAGSATITSNSIYNNGTGIRFTAGGSGSVTGNNFLGPITNFLANGTDLRLDSTAGAVSIGAANLFGGGSSSPAEFANPVGYYIDNRSSQTFNLIGSGSTFNRSNGSAWTALSTGVLADNFRIEDRLYHALDNATSGRISVAAGTLYVTTPGTGASNESIQRGVNAAVAGETIRVEAGTFVENVIVDEEVAIWGAGQGSTIVVPSFVGANTGGGTLSPGHSSIFLIRSNNVTIRNLTADGNNPLLTSGEVVNGVDVDARNGIVTDHATIFTPITNLNVQNVTVQNIWLRGIYSSTSFGTFSFTNNVVQNVAGDPGSIGIFNFGGSGLISGNQVSQTNDGISANHSMGTTFIGNTVSNSASGIHTDNAGDSGGVPDIIQGNTVQNGTAGSYGIFVFVPYNTVQVTNNIVNDVDVGLAAFAGAGGSVVFTGNQVDLASRAASLGAWVSTTTFFFGSGDVDATFTNNSIKNASTLLLVEQENAMDAFIVAPSMPYRGSEGQQSGVLTTQPGDETGEVVGGIDSIDVKSDGMEEVAGLLDDQPFFVGRPVFAAGPVVATVVLNGNTFDNTATSLLNTIGVDVNGGTLTVNAGNQILGTPTGLRMSAAVTPVILSGNTLSDLIFSGVTGNYITLQSGALDNLEINGTGVSYNGIVGGAVTTAQGLAIEDKIQHAIDAATLGFIRIRTGNVYVTTNSFATTEGTTFADIQRGVDAATAGNTVWVGAGNFNNDVVINKVLNLVGSGMNTTTIYGVGPTPSPYATAERGSATIAVQASGVVVEGFTITRLGNNTTDWNNPGLNSAGLAVQGLTNSAEVRNNRFVGNRSGIDINNSNGNNIHNNIIDNNRTGLIFRNQTDNTLVTENFITNNWTVGVLFLDGSGGSNSPVQSAANSAFFNNNISGNWYGQIVDRQSGGLLPAPGTTNLKNFSGNWLGTTSPVVTVANSAEPGYAALIPVIYGGVSVPPGGQPDIAGSASANIDYSPYLGTGTDLDADPTNGFQGDFSLLYVTTDGAQTGGVGRITEALGMATSGGTINVLGGSYTDNVNTTVQPVVLNIGTGTTSAVVTINGSLTMGASTTVNFNLKGPNVSTPVGGTDYDQIVTTGATNLGGATFNISKDVGYFPIVGANFALIRSTALKTGNFNYGGAVAENAVIAVDGINFQVNYNLGAGPFDLNLGVTIPNNIVYVWSGWAGESIGDYYQPAPPVSTLTAPPGGYATFSGTPVTFGYNAFASIQAAINAVSSGGIIRIYMGTYNEDVVVSSGKNNLQLVAFGAAGLRTINGVAGGASATVTFDGTGTIFTGNNASDNFLVNQTAADNLAGIRTATGSLGSTVNFVDVAGSISSTAFTGVDIGAGTWASYNNGNISYFRTGIKVNNNAGSAVNPIDIQNSVINGSGWASLSIFPAGVDVGQNGFARLTNGNVISGNRWGVRVLGGTAMLQGNNLSGNSHTGSSAAGLFVANGGVVDAGQVIDGSEADYTGLGISTGNNLFTSGYAMGGAQAIVNLNANFGGPPSGTGNLTDGTNISARNNNFNTTIFGNVERIVNHAIDNNFQGYVDYRNATGVVAPTQEGSTQYYAINPVGGPQALQRSIIRGVQFVIDSPVIMQSGAVAVNRTDSSDPMFDVDNQDFYLAVYGSLLPVGSVPLNVTSSVSGTTGRTTVNITFQASSFTTSGSLVDGFYERTVNSSLVDLLFSGSGVNYNNAPVPVAQTKFHRLFGDVNGDQFVDSFDNARFQNAYRVADSNWAQFFDYNNNGVSFNDLVDFQQFQLRLGGAIL